ncbi:MAG: mercuric reductase [bacterium]|nr:mercuric reductase [bacterium]
MTRSPMLPDDEFNRALVHNVHPSNYTNPEPSGRYNLVVVGAGSAGLITASIAAGLGAKVALIERHLMGGDCLNVGCVPSKSLIRSARAVGDVQAAGAFGVHVPEGVRIDFGQIMERMRRIRSEISQHDSVTRYRDELGVEVYLGDAHFCGPDAIEVAGATLRFKKAVIATGARAAELPIPGLMEAGYLSNETVFSLTELPRRLAVIGAGPIGCEMAQAFRRFGSGVSLFEIADHILPREDADAAAVVQEALQNDGVKLLLSSRVVEVRKTSTGRVIVYEDADGTHEIEADEILLGIGRAPNVEGLGLEAAGVEYDTQKGVHVDDNLRTANKHIFAAGDICLAPKFTHTADASAKIVVRNALFFGRQKFSDLVIPWCTYTEPEVAHVGLYEREAHEAGIEIDTYVTQAAQNDRSKAESETRGFVKIHVKKGSDKIVGATIVNPHAGEMISEVTTAIVADVGLAKLAEVIHPYPTQAEAIKTTTGAYMRTRLTPGVEKLFKLLMRFSR